MERAKEMLVASEENLNIEQYRTSLNRSYYAIFHALRAVTALDGFDSSKHSGIISYMNREYVKTGVFEKRLSKILDTAFRLREKADYDDFFIVSSVEPVSTTIISSASFIELYHCSTN